MTEAVPRARLAQIRQLRRIGQIGEVNGLAVFPGAAEQAFAGIDGVRAQITVQRDRGGGGLLQNAGGHFDQRRTAFGKESRLQHRAGAIGQIKRAAVRIEDAHRAFDDQAMQIMRPDDVAKSFAEAVEEIENETFLDLDFLVRAFEPADAPALPLIGQEPADERRRRAAQKEESAWERSRVTSLGFRVGGLA